MDAGLFRHFGAYEMHIAADFSGIGAPASGFDYGGMVQISSTCVLEPSLPTSYGVKLRIDQLRENSILVGPRGQYEFVIEGFVSVVVPFSTYSASRSMTVVFTDLKLYWFGTYWEVRWDDVELSIDGVSYATYGAGTVNNLAWAAKSAVPLFGIQPYITGTAAAAENPLYSVPPPTGQPPFDVSATVLWDGGWRFQEPGSSVWVTPPVTMDVMTPPSIGGCGSTASSYVKPTATNTYDGHGEAFARSAYSGGTPASMFKEGYSSTLWLVDDCPASIARVGSDYQALWYRGGFPQTRHRQYAACADSLGGGSASEAFTEEHPLTAELLSGVGNAAHAIEDVFSYGVVCPYIVTGLSTYVSTTDGIQYTHERSSSFPHVTSSSTQLPYYKPTTSEVAEYMNYWGCRHGQFFYWFPDYLGTGVQWDVLGLSPTTLQFWMPEAKQHITHPSLPGAEDRQTQNNLNWAPLLTGLSATGGHVFSGIFANAPTSFVGLHNFTPMTPEPPASFVLDADSEDAWEFTDCTAAFGAGGITLTPTGSPAEIVAVFDAGMFGVEPYLYPMLAESVTVNVNAANVTSMEVFLVDSLGKELSISTGAYPDTHVFTSEQDEYYAGSWAQNRGGSLVSNVGVDQEPTGQSLSHMTASEFAQTFQMFTGRGAHKLKFVIVPTNPAVTVELEYPEYTYCGNEDPVFVPECSAQTAVLWPDGPGVRWGQYAWFYSGALQSTPVLRPSMSRSSALDALVTRRVLFEAEAGDNGLDAEIASLWDSVEGQTRAKANEDTLGFWLPTS